MNSTITTTAPQFVYIPNLLGNQALVFEINDFFAANEIEEEEDSTVSLPSLSSPSTESLLSRPSTPDTQEDA
jgi:hypothetical protein